MTEFDDFVKKKNEEIQAAKEDSRVRDATAKEHSANIKRFAPIEWSKILPSIKAETDGRIIDQKRFLPTGDNGL
jgi:hypothetical protein